MEGALFLVKVAFVFVGVCRRVLMTMGCVLLLDVTVGDACFLVKGERTYTLSTMPLTSKGRDLAVHSYPLFHHNRYSPHDGRFRPSHQHPHLPEQPLSHNVGIHSASATRQHYLLRLRRHESWGFVLQLQARRRFLYCAPISFPVHYAFRLSLILSSVTLNGRRVPARVGGLGRLASRRGEHLDGSEADRQRGQCRVDQRRGSAPQSPK